MQFDSLADFMSMQGHGVFVWSVYAITLVILVALTAAPLRKRRRFFIEQMMRERRQQNPLEQNNCSNGQS